MGLHGRRACLGVQREEAQKEPAQPERTPGEAGCMGPNPHGPTSDPAHRDHLLLIHYTRAIRFIRRARHSSATVVRANPAASLTFIHSGYIHIG
jgi:hypothetical protein